MAEDAAKLIRKTPAAVKLSLAICLLAGILLLVLSALEIGKDWNYVGFVMPALWHDMGIALVVSFVVGGLFELYRSNRHQMEAMRDVIDVSMGDKITGAVWHEVQELIESKAVIRRNVRLQLEFEASADLGPLESVLKVAHEYQLWPLRNKRSTANIRHELDYQFRNDDLGLPRWEKVVILPMEARKNTKPIDLSGPSVQVDVRLSPRRDEEYVFVQTQRRELAHVPGSYNFYTPEFMKGLNLSVENCPDHVAIEVWIRPHGSSEALADQGGTWTYDQLIFPGQGVEIKFIVKSKPREASGESAIVSEIKSLSE